MNFLCLSGNFLKKKECVFLFSGGLIFSGRMKMFRFWKLRNRATFAGNLK